MERKGRFYMTTDIKKYFRIFICLFTIVLLPSVKYNNVQANAANHVMNFSSVAMQNSRHSDDNNEIESKEYNSKDLNTVSIIILCIIVSDVIIVSIFIWYIKYKIEEKCCGEGSGYKKNIKKSKYGRPGDGTRLSC